VVSGYDWDPIPNSSWIAWELLQPLADVDDLAWIAAVGTLSDLGDEAPWAPLGALKKRHTAKALKEAVALVNAARRAPAFDVARPLRLLLEVEDPRAFGDDAALRQYRAEVNAALREARKAAPKFSKTRPFALVKVHSDCQVHPLIAQQWRTRLPKYAVIGANTGYLPGVVAFSARTARTDLVLPEIFRATGITDAEGRFGHGHDQASGGHLPPPDFDRLLDALGFDATAHVRAPGAA
jgi:single-stranded-DNA-specific exonuclease